jgi:hypothetical protein
MNGSMGHYGCQISLKAALQPVHASEIYNKLHAKCKCSLKVLHINYFINCVDFLISVTVDNNFPSNYCVLMTVT